MAENIRWGSTSHPVANIISYNTMYARCTNSGAHDNAQDTFQHITAGSGSGLRGSQNLACSAPQHGLAGSMAVMLRILRLPCPSVLPRLAASLRHDCRASQHCQGGDITLPLRYSTYSTAVQPRQQVTRLQSHVPCERLLP
jgi:hypothetical protein